MFSSSVKTLASAGVATASRRVELSLLRRASSSTGRGEGPRAQPPPLSTIKATKKNPSPPSTSGASRPKPPHLSTLLPKNASSKANLYISKKPPPSLETPVKPTEPLSGSEAGSLSLLDEPEPTPPRLSDKMRQSRTCVFIQSGADPRPYFVLATLEGEGFQIKGLVASVQEKGVFVDLYSEVEQRRALELKKKFPFPIKPSPRDLEYSDPDNDTSVSAFEGIFESAARVKAAAAASSTPPPLLLSSQKKTTSKPPSTSTKPRPTPPPTPTSPSPKKCKPTPTRTTPPPPSLSTLKSPEPPLTPISTDASLNFNHAKLTRLLQQSNVTIERICSNRELFKGEDGSIFAQVEIKGFPHRVYISTSLITPPLPPPKK